MLSRARKATTVGIATALLGLVAALPDATIALEEFLGLRVLFRLRGPATPPSELVIIAMDRESAKALDAGDDFSAWPRRLAADLIGALSDAGVACTGYDVHFGEKDDRSQDASLQTAIANAPAIVLLDYMERSEDRSQSSVTVVRNRRIRPLPEFADAASATAPFPLQRRPYLVASYSTFLPSAYGAATLPAALFGLCAGRSEELLERKLEEHIGMAGITDRDLESRMLQLREMLRYDAALTSQLKDTFGVASTVALETEARDRILSLIDLYSGPELRYLNFYGPPGTIRTIPFADVLERGLDADPDWSRTAVFVGYSDDAQSNRDDTFPTLWSTSNGRDLSGVEIAATAFGNLVDGTGLRPVLLGWQGLLIIAAFGLVLGVAIAPRSAAAALAAIVVVTGAYTVLSTERFTDAHQWWPLVVPLLLQAPAAIFLSLFLGYRQERLRQHALERGASLYLPPELVDRIARSQGGDARSSELVHGTCMVTDVEGFTEFSERTPPRALEHALNAYYEKLYQIVQRHGGLVTDIVGDSMVAVWRDGPQGRTATQAISAAREAGAELGSSTDQFPRTRIGVHAGEFVLGSVGADKHLEYRAVGNVINSTSRVQALNKPLGTTILVTRDVLAANQAGQRYLGRFQLAGKEELLDIFELFTERSDISADRLTTSFEKALELFLAGEWLRARGLLESTLQEFPGDGPSLYLLRTIAASGGFAPTRWEGVMRIDD